MAAGGVRPPRGAPERVETSRGRLNTGAARDSFQALSPAITWCDPGASARSALGRHRAAYRGLLDRLVTTAIAMNQSATGKERASVTTARLRRKIQCVRQFLSSTASAVRQLPDRVLHARRRETARRALHGAGRIRTILVICHGNVCRSPFAAALLRRLATELDVPVVVRSAGFIGPDRQPPAAALAAASRRKLDLDPHRSTLVTRAALDTADLVIVMAPEQELALRRKFGDLRGTALVLGDLDPKAIVRRAIHDPWGGNDAAFEYSYSRIERCVEELAGIITRTWREQGGHIASTASQGQ